MNYKRFVEGNKTLLVAPAGYGKTHTIAECLKYTTGRQLILTHTHAGVSAIKDKLKNAEVSAGNYYVETISSLTQRYVHAFYPSEDIPPQEKTKEYYPFILDRAAKVFSVCLIKSVLKATYSGLFVDEYQDCTKDQHHAISEISNSLKTHLLGDPLQGIFNFNNDLVDFDLDLCEFERFPDLSTPHRWYKKYNNKSLGDKLVEVREKLECGGKIDLSNLEGDGVGVFSASIDDLQKPASECCKTLQRIIENRSNEPDYESLLIIVPEYTVYTKGAPRPKGDIHDRAKIRNLIDISRSLSLLEAVDDRSFYAMAKNIDKLLSTKSRPDIVTKKICLEILSRIFQKTAINKWFNKEGALIEKNKGDGSNQLVSKELAKILSSFISDPSPRMLEKLILDTKRLLRLKTRREGLLYATLDSLKESSLNDRTVYEAMQENRNALRRTGRKVKGKCIGTTLLTKGLEFDTVVVLGADKYECRKNLYVALTRSCKRLYIYSSNIILSPQ